MFSRSGITSAERRTARRPRSDCKYTQYFDTAKPADANIPPIYNIGMRQPTHQTVGPTAARVPPVWPGCCLRGGRRLILKTASEGLPAGVGKNFCKKVAEIFADSKKLHTFAPAIRKTRAPNGTLRLAPVERQKSAAGTTRRALKKILQKVLQNICRFKKSFLSLQSLSASNGAAWKWVGRWMVGSLERAGGW